MILYNFTHVWNLKKKKPRQMNKQNKTPCGTSGKEPDCQCGRLETWVRSLGQKDPVEEEMATHCIMLVWKIPRIEEPDGLPSTGWQRVRRD